MPSDAATPTAPTPRRRRARRAGNAARTDANRAGSASGSAWCANASRKRRSRSRSFIGTPRQHARLGQPAGQGSASPSELRFHGADRTSEDRRHIAFGQVGVVAQDDGLPLARRQRPDGVQDDQRILGRRCPADPRADPSSAGSRPPRVGGAEAGSGTGSRRRYARRTGLARVGVAATRKKRCAGRPPGPLLRHRRRRPRAERQGGTGRRSGP